jgi:hypothetical protein
MPLNFEINPSQMNALEPLQLRSNPFVTLQKTKHQARWYGVCSAANLFKAQSGNPGNLKSK